MCPKLVQPAVLSHLGALQHHAPLPRTQAWAVGRHLLHCACVTPALIEALNQSAAMVSSSCALSREAASSQRSEAEDILAAKRKQLHSLFLLPATY